MALAPADKSLDSLNFELLTQGLTEFSILRRNKNIYPDQHPSIAPLARKVLAIFNQLAAGAGKITIGIAKDALIISDTPLARKNPVFQDVAKALFAHEIAAITIYPDIASDELTAFIEIINTLPVKIVEQGGIVQAVSSAGIRHIQVTDIDYGAFRLTEDEAVTDEPPATGEGPGSLLWERFVRGLINDVLDQGGELEDSFARIDPARLAELINQQKEAVLGRTLSYAQAIVQFVRKAKRDGCDDELDKVGRFINELNPELRKEFLVSTLEAVKDDRRLTGQYLAKLSNDAILDALIEVNARGETVSPYLRALMERLSSLGVSMDVVSAAKKAGQYDQAELADKLRTLLQDDQTELFLPVDYEKLIRSIISTGQISAAEIEEREQLLNSLIGHPVEIQVNAVILNLLEQPSGEDRPEVLKQHIAEMLSYFLDIGDYVALCNIYDRLSGNIEDSALKQELVDLFARPELVNEVLNSVSIWGKAKYGDIQSLIKRVGMPFLEPILDKLAEEESMSLRRFYMERLLEFGSSAVESTVARLRDDRWYVVRNMLVLLRTMDAAQTVSQVRRLRSHPHPRIHQEVLRTLIYFQDPEADRQLLLDLKSDKQELQSSALQLAETSKNPQVLARLLQLLKNGGDFELKIVALQTLAKIGNPAVLPELGQLLKTTSILHPISMHKFKLEIVRSLERYPMPQVGELLATIPELGDKELTLLADEISRKLQAKRL